jgi:hypothetical protein
MGQRHKSSITTSNSKGKANIPKLKTKALATKYESLMLEIVEYLDRIKPQKENVK